FRAGSALPALPRGASARAEVDREGRPANTPRLLSASIPINTEDCAAFVTINSWAYSRRDRAVGLAARWSVCSQARFFPRRAVKDSHRTGSGFPIQRQNWKCTG